MNNMYDILNKMSLLESKGSKPDFLDLDKDGNKKEPMSQAAKQAKKIKEDETLGEKWDTETKVSQAEKGKYAGKGIAELQKAYNRLKASGPHKKGSPEFGRMRELAFAIRAKKGWKGGVDEAQTAEGNAFTAKLKATPKGGEFKMGDKTYRDTSDLDEAGLDINLLKAAQKHAKEHPAAKDPESERNIGKKYGYRSDRDDSEDDDYDEWGNEKKKKKKDHVVPGEKKGRGRPKGSKRAIGAKGPTGKSKLLKKGAIKEQGIDDEGISLVDKGEYDREGDMAREQLHTALDAAKELHDILDADENLPEWVQSKITKAVEMLDTARDYMKASDAEDAEQAVPERKLTKPEMSKREKYVKSMKKSKGDFEKRYGERGEEVMYATATKMAKKKGKEETEESTVAGSVAVAPASGKGKKGMIFGKGVYESQIEESFEKKLSMITEGMSINASQGEDGSKSLTITASDEDAVKLAQILKLAGMGSSAGYEETCPACGQSPCGCEQVEEGQEDVANAPEEETQTADYMTKTIAGGLNKNKVTGMTTIPVVPTQQVTEAEVETRLINLYKQYKP